MEQTCDDSIRRSLKLKLSTLHDGEDAVVIDELRVNGGSSRIDIAVINGRIEGFEIKSDKDTLDRLSNQAVHFSQIADRMTLIVGQKHLAKAIAVVPDWWSIQTATISAGVTHLKSVRRGRLNAKVDKRRLLDILERMELQALLSIQMPKTPVSGISKQEMADLASRRINKTVIDQFVRHALKVRARTHAAAGRTAFGRSALICSAPSLTDADLL